MTRHLLFAALACALLPASSFAQVKIAWKLDAGDAFFVEETGAVVQKLRLRDEELEHRHKHTRISRLSVKSMNDGSLVVEQRILKVSGEADAKLQSALGKLEGAELVFTINPQMRIARMEGYDKLIARIGGNPALLKQALTPEALRAGVELLFAFVPEKEVNEGDVWKGSTIMPFGPLGKFESKNTYGLKQAKPLDRLTIDMQSKWQLVEAPREELKQMKIAGVVLQNDKAGGKIVFDSKAGRVVSVEVEYTIQGVMTIALPNPAEMKFNQQGSMVLRVFDKMP